MGLGTLPRTPTLSLSLTLALALALTLRSEVMPVGPAGEASSRSCSALKVTRLTVCAALVIVPKEPRSTVAVTWSGLGLGLGSGLGLGLGLGLGAGAGAGAGAVTVKLRTPSPQPTASAETTLPPEMEVQSTRLVANEVRPSRVKSRWLRTPGEGQGQGSG